MDIKSIIISVLTEKWTAVEKIWKVHTETENGKMDIDGKKLIF